MFQQLAADEVGEATPSTIEDLISGIAPIALPSLWEEQLPMQGPAPVRRGAGPQPEAEQTGSKKEGSPVFPVRALNSLLAPGTSQIT
ncbi:hypothetical protein [Neorhizobium galegae]|uniref:hypothetical protein n=1 Tax=Neorhizobium galegae TaxID=399 RepID=UPI000B331043|nr:hypothetical protein [Neorhizobium galegae]KAB1121105.1 hypothetical protein F4V90_26060 [Neorhizobium galegae]MCQ1807490.1 hypothetical protein [Neorhizobium galegae]